MCFWKRAHLTIDLVFVRERYPSDIFSNLSSSNHLQWPVSLKSICSCSPYFPGIPVTNQCKWMMSWEDHWMDHSYFHSSIHFMSFSRFNCCFAATRHSQVILKAYRVILHQSLFSHCVFYSIHQVLESKVISYSKVFHWKVSRYKKWPHERHTFHADRN